MKYLSILFLALSVTANAGNYTQPKQSIATAESVAISKQHQNQQQLQTSKNINKNITEGGHAKAYGGSVGDIDNSVVVDTVDNNNINVDLADAVKIEGSIYNAGDLSNNISHETSIGMYQPRDFISYQAPLGEVKVGDVSVTTSACGFTVGYNQERRQFGGSGGAIAGGCSFPIGGAKSALKTATDKLDYELHVMKANEARTEVLHAINVQQMVERHTVDIRLLCHQLHIAGRIGDTDAICDNNYGDVNHSPEVKEAGADLLPRTPGHH